jgi:hypothetical protein
MLRRRFKVLLVTGAIACLAAGAAVACFSAPPADLPTQPIEPPVILSSSVEPPAGQVLTELPSGGEFEVPVRVSAGESFQWEVFVDYDAKQDPNYSNPRTAGSVPADSATDGGVTVVPFFLSGGDFEPWQCPHQIEFFVAYQFNLPSSPTPESYGGDSISWVYDPIGCLNYDDAGDGSFPPADAEPDSLPVAPESGTDL